MTAALTDQTAEMPRVGDERTKAQAKPGWGSRGMIPGLSAVPHGTYETYRKMKADPTLALARSVVRSPIEAGAWRFEADEDAPPDALAFIEDQLAEMRPLIMSEMLDAMDMGWQGFEKVFVVTTWTPPGGGRARPVIELRKLKPLLQDITEILIDKESGAFEGFKQKDVTVDVPNCLLYSFDKEGDNYHGRSRFENARGCWSWWNDANKGAAQYDKKVAGVFPHITYPPGQGRDKSGSTQDNYDLACGLASAIQAGQPIVTPKGVDQWTDEEDMLDPKAQAWSVELLEDKGPRQVGFIDRLRYLDSLKMRAMLRPERVALEGQFGTKAEAGVHQDLAVLDGELIDEDIARHINWYVVDQLLALNFGEEARGTVRITPAPLQDELKVLYIEMTKALLSNPVGLELLLERLDWDAMLDTVGLPRLEQIVNQIEGIETELNGPEGGPMPMTERARRAMEEAVQRRGGDPPPADDPEG